jgi:hypothetical protein
MDDTLKDVAIAFFGLALLSGAAQQRVEHDLRRDLEKTLRGGSIQAHVKPRGLFGLLAGESSVTRITGRNFSADNLPFQIVPGGGPRARIHHLQLDFSDINLRYLPVKRLRADIPSVSLDFFKAMLNGRLVLRSCGQGTAEAVADVLGLRAFVAHKYPQFTDVEIRLTPGLFSVSANTTLLGASNRLDATGKLAAQDGRFVIVTEPTLRMDGKEVPPLLAQNLLLGINPVLDIERDLGLGGYVTITDVEIGEGIVILRGRADFPRQQPSKEKK